MTTVALAAKAIRAELKTKFPSTLFSITSQNFSMGNSISISYQNGIPTKEVEAVTDKYEAGSFDGMEDIYNYRSNPDNLPRAKYITISREIDPKIRDKKKVELAKYWNVGINNEQEWFKRTNKYSDQMVYEELKDVTLN